VTKDQEICMAIACIEDFEPDIYDGRVLIQDGTLRFFEFNPLTDKTLCFNLMVKHKIDIDFTEDDLVRCWQYDHIDGQDTLGSDPQRVICEAIIEANK
jgi:hypothetical protein